MITLGENNEDQIRRTFILFWKGLDLCPVLWLVITIVQVRASAWLDGDLTYDWRSDKTR